MSMLSRVDASELALQLHHYLDSLNDEAVRDFAVVFGSRLPSETRSLLFTTLQEPAESDLRSTVRSAEAQQLKFAMSSVLWIDQSAAEAIPELVQQSLRTYRAFILTDEVVETPRRRRFISYAGIAIAAAATLLVAFLDPTQRAEMQLRIPHWFQHHAPPVVRHAAVHRRLPVHAVRLAIDPPQQATAAGARHMTMQANKHKKFRPARNIRTRPQPVARAANDLEPNIAVTTAPRTQDQLSVAPDDTRDAIETASAYVTDTNPGVKIESARMVQQTGDGAVVEVLSDDDGASITDRIILSVNASGYTVRAQQRAGSASPGTSRACFDGRQWKECSGGE